MVTEGVMTRAPVRESKEWIMLDVIEKMSTGLFTYAIERGTYSWDLVVQRALVLCLLASTGARASDVILGEHYTGVEYLAWKDVEIWASGPSSFSAKVTLRYQKGHK